MRCDMFQTIPESVTQVSAEATRPGLLLDGFLPLVCYGFTLSFPLDVVTFLQMFDEISPSLGRERAWDSLSTYLDVVFANVLCTRVQSSAKDTLETALGLFLWAPKHTNVRIQVLLLMLPPS